MAPHVSDATGHWCHLKGQTTSISPFRGKLFGSQLMAHGQAR